MTYESIWSSLRGVSFSQGWLDAGGIRTRYIASGKSDAPVLVLLHGTGGHAEAYVRNLKAHGSHFRTYAIDLLGHGWTDKDPTYRWTLRNMFGTWPMYSMA